MCDNAALICVFTLSLLSKVIKKKCAESHHVLFHLYEEQMFLVLFLLEKKRGERVKESEREKKASAFLQEFINRLSLILSMTILIMSELAVKWKGGGLQLPASLTLLMLSAMPHSC